MSFKKVLFTPIERIKKGYDFEENYPGASLGKFWQIQFEGICGKDDFALWKGLYLVVSEQALSFLREWNVTKAEADKLDENFEDYFSSEKKNFWV